MAKTWIITGCSTGFGRALAGLLLERGEQVVATARNPDTLEDLIEPHRARALALRLDVTRPDEIAAAVEAAKARFRSVDVLVNNAGYGDVGTIEETPVERARAMMETNLFGAIAMIRAVVTDMRQRRSGQIVNIGSVAGLIGFPALGYYSATKFALAGLTEALAAELRPLGVGVTIAELGPFATGFTSAMTFNPPGTPDYDLARLGEVAGNAGWGEGDDPRAGAAALLSALEDKVPPVHLLLGRPALDVLALHDARRASERAKWHRTSMLDGFEGADGS